MRKIFNFDDLMIAFVSTPGYSISYSVADTLGMPAPLSITTCLVCGILVDRAINIVAYSPLIQKSARNKALAYVAFVLFFLVAQRFSMALNSHDMVGDYFVQLAYIIGIPVLGFVVNMAVSALRTLRIRKRYGDGSKGYVFELDQKDIDDVNGENRPITGDYDTELAVQTKTGIYVGVKVGKNRYYLGIPYAQPPVGDLRWKAPEPLAPSTDVFEAENLGASPIQVEHEGTILKHHRQSEDCLTVNICVSDKESDELRPVFVLFHSLDFSFGGTADPLLNGSAFVASHPDAIFASFNYRLGLFGFIDFAETEGGDAYPDAPNLGLLDQVAALRWIHENIAAFGGDPERVTIIGFEAGGTSICLLAAMDAARGLFQRAFVFNGSPIGAYDDPAPSRALAKSLLEATGTHTMEELARLDTTTLKEVSQGLWQHSYAPTIDGTLIPWNVAEAYRNGVASGIEFIVGISGNDANVFRSFVGNQSYEYLASASLKEVQSLLDEATAKAVSDYVEQEAASSNESEAGAKIAEQFIALVTYRLAADLAAGGSKMHLMYWDKKPLIENLGSGSVDALSTLLGNRDVSEMYGSVMDSDLSEILQTFLLKYVKGDALELYPNEVKGVNEINWTSFPDALIIDDKSVSTGRVEERLTEVKALFDYVMQ